MSIIHLKLKIRQIQKSLTFFFPFQEVPTGFNNVVTSHKVYKI